MKEIVHHFAHAWAQTIAVVVSTFLGIAALLFSVSAHREVQARSIDAQLEQRWGEYLDDTKQFIACRDSNDQQLSSDFYSQYLVFDLMLQLNSIDELAGGQKWDTRVEYQIELFGRFFCEVPGWTNNLERMVNSGFHEALIAQTNACPTEDTK
ncbi:MAG: hypothetical protein AAGL68_11750 [Pseudomonadota bacterium]